MTVVCQSCKRITEGIKTVKGKAPCCGTFNSLEKVNAIQVKALREANQRRLKQ